MPGRRLSEVIKMMDSQGDTGIQASTAGSTANAVVSVAGYDLAAVQLDGGGSTYAATVQFEVTVNGSDWVAVQAMNPADASLATAVSNDTGIHVINVSGFSGLQLNVTAYTNGNVTGSVRRAVGGGGALSMADIEISDVVGDSDVNIYGLDTDATFSAIQMDSADGALIVRQTGDTVILPADAMANPTLVPQSLVHVMAWDDTGWDRLRIDDANRLKVMEDWNSTLQSLEATTTLNDTDFAVPADKDWHVMWIWVEYTSGATAGTRQLRIDVRDSGDDVIMSMVPGVTQAESLTYFYMFAPGMPDLTAVRDTDFLYTPMPPSLIIPELFDIRIYDELDFTSDTAEDEMVLQMMVMDRSRVSTA